MTVKFNLALRLCTGPTHRFLVSDKPASKVFLCDTQAKPQLSHLGIDDTITKVFVCLFVSCFLFLRLNKMKDRKCLS